MYFVVFAIGSVLLLWYIIRYYKWRKELFSHIEKLPGPKRYPFIGTVYLFAQIDKRDVFLYYENYLKSMPPLFRTWHGSIPEINVRKPEHLEIVMNNTVHITKGKLYNHVLPWLGEGLLLSTGTKWHERRKLITPTFHFKILEKFMDVFVEKSKCLVDQLEIKADGRFFDIYPSITQCALDVICETAMGYKLNAMQNKHSDYVNSIYSLCDIVLWRFMRPYISWDRLFYMLPMGRKYKNNVKTIHNLSLQVISDKRKLLQQNCGKILEQNKRLSFLDLLLEASKYDSSLTDNDIREEVDTFMFEGHDTTTVSMCWTLFLLGNHLNIQNKVYSELQEVLEDKMVPTTIDELNRLKYLECVIKEALRLYPSVPGVSRTVVKEFYIDNYKIPKGAQLNLHIYQVHRDPEYYPEPEKFDPDRFLPENCVERHPFAYIPFSAGARNCIGQKFALYEEKTVLASILKAFEVQSADRPEDVQVYGTVILRPVNGINVKLTKRV